ncbi:MAG: hypothetical protein O7D86_14470 [Proteobacteria bacterium]|nr:hypothetical protein [Pseudomonadota bacterium]
MKSAILLICRRLKAPTVGKLNDYCPSKIFKEIPLGCASNDRKNKLKMAFPRDGFYLSPWMVCMQVLQEQKPVSDSLLGELIFREQTSTLASQITFWINEALSFRHFK